MKLNKAADIEASGSEETFSYHAYPSEQRKSMRMNNSIEIINREIRRRVRVVGSVPEGNSSLMLLAARLWQREASNSAEGTGMDTSSTKYGTREYMDMERFYVKPQNCCKLVSG